MKHVFYLLLCLAVVMGVTACAGVETDYLAAVRGDFRAILRGERQGVAFEATAQVRELGDGTREVCLFYTAPEGVRDLAVSGLLGADGRIEGGTATLRGLSVPMEESALRGLLAPVPALLEAEQPLTVRMEGDVCHLTFPEEKTLTLVRRGSGWIPQRYTAEGLIFDWIEAE